MALAHHHGRQLHDARRPLVLNSQSQGVTQCVIYGWHDGAVANHTVDFRIEYSGEIIRHDYRIVQLHVAVGLQFRLRQIASHLADRNGGHDLTIDHFVGQLAMGPAIDRSSGLLGRLTDHG